MSAAKDPENALSSFVTLCHGEPWSGNVQYRYSDVIATNNNNEEKDGVNEQERRSPVEAVFGGKFLGYLLYYLTIENYLSKLKYLKIKLFKMSHIKN